jgi:parallel beta-helix repeat protein
MSPLARLAAGLALLLAGCAHAPVGRPSVPQVTLVERDTEWRGDVRVDGIVHVRKNATLTIAPGTRVLFADRAFAAGEEHEGFVAPGFKIEGRVVASGTEEAPILFSTAGGGLHPAAWDKLLFTFSTGSRFEWCTFEGARYAFHTHFSELAVSHCTFRDNEEGMRMGNSKILIEDSVFTRNEIRGINFRDCRNEIRRNLVYGNGDGIFLHSKDAASVIRENAIYDNRHFNLRLGDLHAEDFDAGGNWWGTRSEPAAREKVYDGGKLAGIGKARLAPMLALPPVTGAEIRGVIVSGQSPVEGAELRALSTVADGFFGEDRVAEALSDADGLFTLRVPPGRWFVAGRKGAGAGSLFSFPGRNPVPVEFGGREGVAMPSVVVNGSLGPEVAPSSRQGVTIRVTSGGAPVPGATVQAFRPDAPDFRGPGESSALTGESGAATLSLRPGRYLLAARKRPGGASLGVVEEGGLFGVWPGSPVEVRPSTIATVEIPVVEKRGLIGGAANGVESADDSKEKALDGSATIAGVPAGGYIVYFYRPGETIGRPLARSTVLSAEGGFSVSLSPDAEYVAFLRKAIPGVPGGVGEERFGPAPVSTRTGRLEPRTLRFEAAPR